MMRLNCVTIYTPENPPYGDSIVYFRSEDGQDFYEAQSLFTRKYKLCIESDTGIIRSIAEDVSKLYPAGYTVVETNYLPKGCDIYGGWMYENEVVKPVPVDYAAKAESERQRLLKTARDTISIWQTQLSLGSITDANKASLVKWLAYIEELTALNLSCVEGEQAYNGIEWPEIPSKESSN